MAGAAGLQRGALVLAGLDQAQDLVELLLGDLEAKQNKNSVSKPGLKRRRDCMPDLHRER